VANKLARIPLPPQEAPLPRYYAEGPAREATPEHVQTELTRLALANVADIISVDKDGQPRIDLSVASREALSPIASISSTRRTIYNAQGVYLGEETTVRVGLADKLKALELQGKVLGMFKPVEVKVTLDLADRLLAARQRLAGGQ
jgi:hypothetical protein